MPFLSSNFKLQTSNFTLRYKRFAPVVSFVVGFVYDTLTLTRIDRLSDNLQMLAYLLLSGGALVTLALAEHGRLRHDLILKRLDWVQIVFNFCLGGLLSAYAIYYFRSAAFSKSYIFVGVLAAVWLSNEFLPHRFSRLRVLSLMHFFCSCAFFTFFLPVVTHRLGLVLFIAGGVLSLLFTVGLWTLVLGRELFRPYPYGRDILLPPTFLFLVLVVLYIFNWIPPVPLSTRDIGIYRSVKRVPGARYEVTYRRPEWFEITRRDDRVFAYTPGDAIYCFAAIFAPTDMRQKIFHAWQQRLPDGTWKTTDRIPYPIVGGREEGWRGYTMKRQISPGSWRIDVITENGQILGRIGVSVVAATGRPESIVTEYK